MEELIVRFGQFPLSDQPDLCIRMVGPINKDSYKIECVSSIWVPQLNKQVTKERMPMIKKKTTSVVTAINN